MTDPRGSECGCALCGQTFTGLTLFDAHQDTDYNRHPVIVCRDPRLITLDSHGHPVPPDSPRVARGLQLVQDARGTWGTPAGLKKRESMATRLAAANSERRAQ